MSNFNIGDTVRIGSGKVEYAVDSFPTEGQAFVIGEKSSRTVETTRLVLVKAAQMAPSAPEGDETPNVEGEPFDPRTDRRQSAYGLSILAAVMRKNPNAARLGVNPFKPIGSTRPSVRKAVKAKRRAMHEANAQYNTLRRNVA